LQSLLFLLLLKSHCQFLLSLLPLINDLLLPLFLNRHHSNSDLSSVLIPLQLLIVSFLSLLFSLQVLLFFSFFSNLLASKKLCLSLFFNHNVLLLNNFDLSSLFCCLPLIFLSFLFSSHFEMLTLLLCLSFLLCELSSLHLKKLLFSFSNFLYLLFLF
jgi:hypothetical protein